MMIFCLLMTHISIITYCEDKAIHFTMQNQAAWAIMHYIITLTVYIYKTVLNSINVA